MNGRTLQSKKIVVGTTCLIFLLWLLSLFSPGFAFDCDLIEFSHFFDGALDKS